jgi:hypothetical protein
VLRLREYVCPAQLKTFDVPLVRPPKAAVDTLRLPVPYWRLSNASIPPTFDMLQASRRLLMRPKNDFQLRLTLLNEASSGERPVLV